jgi:hypothetical protein
LVIVWFVIAFTMSGNSEAINFRGLGDLPGGPFFVGVANDVSDHGKVVVGLCYWCVRARGVSLDQRRRHGRPGQLARR